MIETFLYRHFDEKGTLLYVGIATDMRKRTKQHMAKSPWASQIHSTTVKAFKTRIKAAIAELQIIDREKPLYNIIPGAERRRKLGETPVMFSTRIPKELVTRMAEVCEKEKITRSNFMRAAIEKMLDTQ